MTSVNPRALQRHTLYARCHLDATAEPTGKSLDGGFGVEIRHVNLPEPVVGAPVLATGSVLGG